MIGENANDMELLEVLFLLYQAPGRSWTASEVAAALPITEAAAGEQLERLARRHLLDVRIGTAVRYRYAPATDELAEAVARLYGGSSG